MRSHRLIERYIIRTIFPYALIALALLTGILFVQQSGRYLETIFRTTVPAMFLYSLAPALLPTVLNFTLPMALLCGTIIGLGRMGSDSELVAMRAAGVSRWQVLLPVLLIGLITTAAAWQLNMNEAPRAQRELRNIGARAALYKLDSPVEPQTFTTDIPGYVIYVREGDKSRGQWGGVFIQSREGDGSTQLITARTGGIDSSDEKSELVLHDAMRSTIPAPEAVKQDYVVERLSQLRKFINTGRNELLSKLRAADLKSDEMTFSELRHFIDESSGPEQREAQIIFHKRLAFSVSPIVFVLFGAGLAMRLRRGSRGFGAFLSVVVMLIYYLLMIGGEQLARGGTLPPIIGGWLATLITTAVGVALLLMNRTLSFPQLRRKNQTHQRQQARAK
jgi:lipopolysaccharide export system permease protein